MHSQDRRQPELTQFCVDHAAEVIFLLDEQACFVYANDAALAHLQYSREELTSLRLHQIDPNYPPDAWKKYWLQIQEKGMDSLESQHITKSGKKISVEIRASYLAHEDKEYLLAFVRDISERKSAEKILLDTEKRLRRMLDVTSDGVWDRDLVTGKIYYGANWAETLGYREEDLHSGKICWEQLLHPEDRERTLQVLEDHFQGKTNRYEAEFRLRNSRNGWQWIHARGKVIEYDNNGRPLRFVGTHNDITERKELEENQVKNFEAIKIFAYSVAHDVKNPALAIKCLAERFIEKAKTLSDRKKIDYCERILDSASQLVELVDKINLFISAKETSLCLEDVPLKDIVLACRNEFAAQLQYRGIKWQIFKESPVIRMDRMSIRRVLRNLVENSLKYGGDDLSTISIGYQNVHGFHVLSVCDDGIGLSIEDSLAIFQPFERKNRSKQTSGSGLGLAIVNEIAQQHKGDVWVEPQKGQGIKFCFAISKTL